jgi:dihydroneopterin aldolase
VVFLSNEAIASDHLTGWIDQLTAGSAPVIICVGPADTCAPQTAAPAVQRRIDLLAIEQNAWLLAARDRRCVVVGSRTELDWAMKNGQMCVWAPSKMVLDAVDGPSASPREAVALALWFANEMEAQRMLVIGETAPKSTDLPIKQHGLGATLSL